MTDCSATKETWEMLGKALFDLMKANERIESDLAEIKARLAHTSPGYDMKCKNCRMYEPMNDRHGMCWLRTNGVPQESEEHDPMTGVDDFCQDWQRRPVPEKADLAEYEARMAGEQEEGR